MSARAICFHKHGLLQIPFNNVHIETKEDLNDVFRTTGQALAVFLASRFCLLPLPWAASTPEAANLE